MCVGACASVPANVCVVCLIFIFIFLSCSVTSGYRIFDRDDFFDFFFFFLQFHKIFVVRCSAFDDYFITSNLLRV